MMALNEENLYLIEEEKNRQNILKNKAATKCNLANIIELIQKRAASIAIIEIPELCSKTISDYIVITYKDYDYALFITMNGDIKLCINITNVQSANYIEEYGLIDIEDGNEKLASELYNYISIVNINNQLEEFIN